MSNVPVVDEVSHPLDALTLTCVTIHKEWQVAAAIGEVFLQQKWDRGVEKERHLQLGKVRAEPFTDDYQWPFYGITKRPLRPYERLDGVHPEDFVLLESVSVRAKAIKLLEQRGFTCVALLLHGDLSTSSALNITHDANIPLSEKTTIRVMAETRACEEIRTHLLSWKTTSSSSASNPNGVVETSQVTGNGKTDTPPSKKQDAVEKMEKNECLAADCMFAYMMARKQLHHTLSGTSVYSVPWPDHIYGPFDEDRSLLTKQSVREKVIKLFKKDGYLCLFKEESHLFVTNVLAPEKNIEELKSKGSILYRVIRKNVDDDALLQKEQVSPSPLPAAAPVSLNAESMRTNKAKAVEAFNVYVEKKAELIVKDLQLDMTITGDPMVQLNSFKTGTNPKDKVIFYRWHSLTCDAVKKRVVEMLKERGIRCEPQSRCVASKLEDSDGIILSV